MWLLNLLALYGLSRRRPYSMLDLWLIVTMCAWLFDIALSAVFNAGRYDLGFYAGRIYGLLAASFVLVVLLHEHGKLYVQLIKLRDSDREKADELRRLSTVDPLTGVANRRAFEDALGQEWRRMMRHGTTLSLLMVDVDCFKHFNDAYGHVAGDRCLRTVAQVLAGKARRAGEMAARYGGEEFAVLLPHIDIAEAKKLGEVICAAVSDCGIAHEHSEAASYVTVSVGAASIADLPELAATLSREGTLRRPRCPGRPCWSRRRTMRSIGPRRPAAIGWSRRALTMPPANRRRHFAFHQRRDGATTGAHGQLPRAPIMSQVSRIFSAHAAKYLCQTGAHPPAAL